MGGEGVWIVLVCVWALLVARGSSTGAHSLSSQPSQSYKFVIKSVSETDKKLSGGACGGQRPPTHHLMV